MDYRIEKGQQDRQPYVAIRATVDMNEISQAMGPLYGQLFGWLSQNNIQAVGAPWTRYLSMGKQDVELEVAVPVAEEPGSDGQVCVGTMAACDFIRTLHVGPYETVGMAYSALDGHAKAHDLQVVGAPWEVYLTDPESQPDPLKWETMVYMPVLATA